MATEVVPKATEAEQARWHQLKTTIRRSKEDVTEWLQAVLEVKETSLWRCKYQSWAEFCEQELDKSASTMWRQLQSGQDPVQVKPELPSFTESDPIQQDRHCQPLARSLKTMVKQYVTLTAQWPQNAKLKAMDKKIIDACGELSIWLEDYCSAPEVERMIRNRKS